MSSQSARRTFAKAFGLSGAFALTRTHGFAQPPHEPDGALDRVADDLHSVIATYELDDTHCHGSGDQYAKLTVQEFLLALSLVALPQAAYFPAGVLENWRAATGGEKARLDHQYNIEKTLAKISYDIRESIFVKYLTKEMAAFLDCVPKLETVVAARNERAGNYHRYIGDLFSDVKLTNVMVDTGCCDGMNATGFDAFAAAILPAKMRGIARVDSIQTPLFREDIPFDELELRFTSSVRQALDGDNNYGFKSWGMKWHQLEKLGVVKPHYDSAAAKRSWEEYKRVRSTPAADREEDADRGRVLKEYFLTIALDECLKRDMPMQIHSGDGEAPGVILRRQHPYFLEEVVRFYRDGVMRMPKIIPIHAGYPLVGEAAWLSHLYTNCYFEISLMNPVIHQGLARRFGEILEAVPMSKVLFGSDSFALPEYNWVAGKWGKRYLSQALAVYVKEKILTREEALEGAQMMLYKNNRRIYNLPA
jgi:predicted TIM-barrel fold metal-dependent hydrolase